MIFIHRLDGVIIGSGANPQTDRAPEPADENNAEWVTYLNTTPNVTIVTKLKLKRKLDELDLWTDLRAVMVQNQDVWDEWLITQDININDPSTDAMRQAMSWSVSQLQDLFNSIGNAS